VPLGVDVATTAVAAGNADVDILINVGDAISVNVALGVSVPAAANAVTVIAAAV
jgi:hypothetical protein